MISILSMFRWLKPHWKSLVVVIWPSVLMPLLAVGSSTEARCGYVVLLMAGFWMTEVVPLAITALLPVMLFPLLGVMSTDAACLAYMKETNMMSIAGLIIAIAIEHCNLHKRIALKVLLMIGTSPKLLMLGFMLNTMFLSMWISNTATVAMMVPIVQAVLEELKESNMTVLRRNSAVSRRSSVVHMTLENATSPEGGQLHDGHVVELHVQSAIPRGVSVELVAARIAQERKLKEMEHKFYKDTLCYYLGVAYAANIGGTGTVTGTGTNLIFLGSLQAAYPGASGVNFASWMIFNVPVMLLNVVVAWLWLQIMHMNLLNGCCGAQTSKQSVSKEEGEEETPADSDDKVEDSSSAVRRLISRRYAELGPVTWHEGAVLTLFVTLVLLWFFRQPEFITGWADLWKGPFPNIKIRDSTPAMCIIMLMFILPSDLRFLRFSSRGRKAAPSLLTWDVIQTKMQWSLVLLLGGGFAMAEGSKVSGLSVWLGAQLEGLAVLPTWLVVGLICLMTTFTTEVASNTAVANILLPVLAEMSRAIKVHPVYLMMPATLCCSYSFMLPIATPPNAIVATAAKIRTLDMMRAGLAMNLLTVLVLLASFNTLGVLVYDLNTFPAWAIPDFVAASTVHIVAGNGTTFAA